MVENLRPCYVLQNVSGEICAERAVFHCWMDRQANLLMPGPSALVEYADGSVCLTPLDNFMFADPLDFRVFKWADPFTGGVEQNRTVEQNRKG